MAKKIEEDFRQMNEQLDALYGQQPQTDIDFRRRAVWHVPRPVCR